MSITVTCECGHVTKLDSNELLDAGPSSPPRCPACGRLLADAARRETEAATEASSVRRTFQQTWQTHWQADQAAEPHPLESAGETAVPSLTHDGDSSPSTSKRRSLWDVMRSAEVATEPTSPAELPPIRRLGLRPDRPLDTEATSPAELPPTPQARDAIQASADEAVMTEVRFSEAEARDSVVGTSSPPLSGSAFPRRPVSSDLASRRWSRRAVLAFALSVAGVLLATLSIQPGWKVRLPSLSWD